MEVVVTGATGFLGARLCQRMVTEGYQVRMLCRRTFDLTAIEALPLEKALGDITDAESVRAAVKGCRYVIHAAANASHRPLAREEQMRVNVEGTRHVARAAHAEEVERVLHISSGGAIGIPTDPNQPAEENFAFNVEHTTLDYHNSKQRAAREVLTECSPASAA